MLKKLSTLNTRKTKGCNEISVWLLFTVAPGTKQSLTLHFGESPELKLFLKQVEAGNISPVFKAGDSNDTSNWFQRSLSLPRSLNHLFMISSMSS